MRQPTLPLFAAAVLIGAASAPAQACGKIEVEYVKPNEFADAGRSVSDREQVMKSLSDYFQVLAKRLPDGQTLHLDVLDIDLAGEIWPVGVNEVRILRGGADWPKMKLRYSLHGKAGTLKSGEAQLADPNYFFGLSHADLRYGDLSYEKRMVQQWFEHTFTTLQP